MTLSVGGSFDTIHIEVGRNIMSSIFPSLFTGSDTASMFYRPERNNVGQCIPGMGLICASRAACTLVVVREPDTAVVTELVDGSTAVVVDAQPDVAVRLQLQLQPSYVCALPQPYAWLLPPCVRLPSGP